jgi:hypothetical protein
VRVFGEIKHYLRAYCRDFLTFFLAAAKGRSAAFAMVGMAMFSAGRVHQI